MISGRRSRLPGVVLALLAAAAARAHDDDGFRALMKEFSALGERRVAYTEVKSLRMLDSEIEQSGMLVFSPPETLIREIRDPVSESYAIIGDTMFVIRNGLEEPVDLDTVPLLRAFIESFRATLAGDIELIGEYYFVEFKVGGNEWTLNLRPRYALGRFIERIEFTGDGTWVRAISIDEADGDSSKITLTEPD